MTNDHAHTVTGIKLAAAAVIVGGMVLVGWAFNIAVLKSILPGWVAMKANAAVCFILIGVALWLTARPPATFNQHLSIFLFRLARLCGLLAGLIGLLTLGEYIFGWNPGIDQWLFREAGGAVGTSDPGRMASETALCFVLLAAALWITGGLRKTRWTILASVNFGLLVTTLALAAVLAYLTPGFGPYGWFGLTTMAMHTSLLFAMLGMAVIAISWQQDILPWSLGRNTTVALACGMALLVFMGLSINRSQFWLVDTNRKIAYSEEVLNNTVSLQVELAEAHAHARGYIITGDERFLKSYLEAIADYNKKMSMLRQLIAGSPHQQQQASLIETNVDLLRQWTQQFIDAPRTGMTNTTRSKMDDHGGDLLDNIRIAFDQIENEHQQFIRKLKQEAESVARFSYITIVTGTFASLLIFLIVIFRLNFAVNERKRVEAALSAGEARLALTIASAELATWDWNIKTGHDIFNERWAEMRGYRLEEIEPHVSSWKNGVNPDDLSAMGITLEEHFKGRTPFFQAEYRVSTKSGSLIWILDRGMVLERDADGNPLRMAGIEIDITERKNSEGKLAESERHFRAVSESANDAIITGSDAGNIVDWNPAAERLFGYSAVEITGQPLTLLIPERFRIQHNEGLARVVAGGTPHIIGKTVEVFGLHKDGSEFPLEISLSKWLANDGQFFTAIIRDITERRRAEDSLRKLSLAVEQSPSSIIITDLDANIEYANAAFVKSTGYSLAEVIGQNPRLLQSGKTPRATYDDMWAHLTRGEMWKGEFINRRKDGREYIETVWFSPVRQMDGCVTNYLAIKEDVTEHKRADAELQSMTNALRDSQRLLDSIIEHIPVMVFVKRASDLRMELFNHAGEKLLGYARNDVLGTNNYDLWPKEQGDWFTAADRKVLASHEVTEIPEEAINTASGETRYLHTWKVALRDENGEPAHLLGISVDITERKLAEAKLAEQLDELRRWHSATSDREKRILELKHEINKLLAQAGQPPRYPSAEP